MKSTKIDARNSMRDEPLSDPSILAIEKEYIIDFERMVDVFATQNKNG
jgi:hypothetical protein